MKIYIEKYSGYDIYYCLESHRFVADLNQYGITLVKKKLKKLRTLIDGFILKFKETQTNLF